MLLFKFQTFKCTLKTTARYIHNIRNVGVVAHIDAGKTTTSEQMLYLSGETSSIGRVDDGDTVMDFLPQERERGITISSAAITFDWNGHHINLIDTPGHVDFTIEVERSARVLDGAVLVLDAVAGVQAQTQTVWKQIKKQKVATIAFINKMDRDGANFERSLKSIETKLQGQPIPLTYPIYSNDNFHGIIDLIEMKKFTWGNANEIVSSRAPTKPHIQLLQPSDSEYIAAISARCHMIEKLVEYDEMMMDTYLSLLDSDDSAVETGYQTFFTSHEIMTTLRTYCLNGTIIPTICGSSLRGKGVEMLLNNIVNYLPSPVDRPPSILIPYNTPSLSLSSSTSSSSSPSSSSSMLSGIDANNTSAKGSTSSQQKKLQKDNKRIELIPTSTELVALAFKVVYDHIRGYLVYIRIYTGTIRSKQVIYNSTKQCKERVNQLLKVYADDYVNIDEASTGDVVCLIGCKLTHTGDTLVADKSMYDKYILEGLSIPEAVYTVTLEPEKSTQRDDLEKALYILNKEDPSLRIENNIESGQLLVKGIGELHIEIVVDKLNTIHKIPTYIGKAYVAYRESLKQFIERIEEIYTYDRMITLRRMFARITCSIEPITAKTTTTATSENTKNIVSELSSPTAVTDPYLMSPIIEINRDIMKKLSLDEYNALHDGASDALNRGPFGYPIVGVKLYIHNIETDIDTTSGSIRACISTFINNIFKNTDNHDLLEPIMSAEIDVPTKYVGTVLSDLTVKRRAEIIEVVTDDNISIYRSIIYVYVPLATMLGYATMIRSMTQGEGQFSMEYYKHIPVDISIAETDMITK